MIELLATTAFLVVTGLACRLILSGDHGIPDVDED
jgi:hypothetical protein